jgi:hypothetical protein
MSARSDDRDEGGRARSRRVSKVEGDGRSYVAKSAMTVAEEGTAEGFSAKAEEQKIDAPRVVTEDRHGEESKE